MEKKLINFIDHAHIRDESLKAQMVTVICFDSIKRLHRPVKRINTYAHNVLTHDHTSTFLKAICALAGYNRHYR